jgi:hypothetical protein
MRDWTMLIFALCTVLAAVAATPTMAQTTTYDCPTNARGAIGSGPNSATQVCIDQITAVIGTSAGGDSIVAHWRSTWVDSGGVESFDFFQIRYAYPGSGETQQKLGGGQEGTYNLVLQPTADPNGDYTFRVQGCWNQTLAPALCTVWNKEIYTISGVGVSTSSQGLTAPQPPQNLHTSISISGHYIQVLWNNPPGVLHATVTRTPAWPSASTLNVPPASGSANLKDILIVSGQRYSYNVCLNYQAGNLCGSVTGELPGPPPINGQITQHPRAAP